ncbi:MAG: hypothetical protein ACPG5B_06465 [Chitinophagales bacterium]
MSTNSVNANWQAISNHLQYPLSLSFKKTNIVAQDHIAKLDARQVEHTEIAEMYAKVLPFYQEFSKAYTRWLNEKSYYKGATIKANDLQDELMSVKYARWSGGIQWLFAKDSAEYATLLPDGSVPFQTGGKDFRIKAVETLSVRLQNYADLAHVQTDVQTFYELMKSARHRQQMHEQNTENASDLLHKAQQDLIDELYYSLLTLLRLYYKDRTKVLAFWQIDLLRTKGSSTNEDTTTEEDKENEKEEVDVPAIDPDTKKEL